MKFDVLKSSIRALFFVCLVLLSLSSGCKKSSSSDLIIAASANMQYAMKDVIEAFEELYDIPCRIVVSSSGKLTAQISSGAPYDLFFSADEKYPNQLFEHNLAVDTPSIYAYGYLALWSISQKDLDVSHLGTSKVKRIAIANPMTAPYGVAAQQMLSHYNFQGVDNKLVFGESISQVNQFVSSEVVDVGVTSISVVLSPLLKSKGYWVKVDSNSYDPIAQSMVIVTKKNEKLESAHLFKKFMTSSQVQSILEEYGFTF